MTERWTKASRVLASCVLGAAIVGALAATSLAGDRQIEVIYVNMTPDAESGGESSACAKAIKGAFQRDYSVVKKLGETKTREATGVPKGGPSFMTWKTEQFTSLLKDHPKHGYSDAVVLVDCRPAKKMLDILLVPASSRAIRLSLRGIAPSKGLIENISKRLTSQAWDGFSP